MGMRRQGIHATRTILVENTGRSSSAHPFSRRFSPIAADPVLLDAVDEDVPGNVEIGGSLGDVPPFQAQGTLDHFLFEIDEGESTGGEGGAVVPGSPPPPGSPGREVAGAGARPPTETPSPRQRITIRSQAFFSSRTFPGQGRAVSASLTSGGTEISRSGLISFMKCSARGGMSSGLSLKGGARISTTF